MQQNDSETKKKELTHFDMNFQSSESLADQL